MQFKYNRYVHNSIFRYTLQFFPIAYILLTFKFSKVILDCQFSTYTS